MGSLSGKFDIFIDRRHLDQLDSFIDFVQIYQGISLNELKDLGDMRRVQLECLCLQDYKIPKKGAAVLQEESFQVLNEEEWFLL